MLPELGVLIGAAATLLLTCLWLKMKKANVNFTSRIGIVLTIILFCSGFAYFLNFAELLLFGFFSMAGLCYTSLIEPQNNDDLKARLRFVRVWIAVELLIYTSTYLTYPGFLIPFLNHPGARSIFTGVMAWQFLGVFLYIKPKEIKNQFLKLIFTLVFSVLFGLPVLVAPTLAPALVTIGTGFFIHINQTN